MRQITRPTPTPFLYERNKCIAPMIWQKCITQMEDDPSVIKFLLILLITDFLFLRY